MGGNLPDMAMPGGAIPVRRLEGQPTADELEAALARRMTNDAPFKKALEHLREALNVPAGD